MRHETHEAVRGDDGCEGAEAQERVCRAAVGDVCYAAAPGEEPVGRAVGAGYAGVAFGAEAGNAFAGGFIGGLWV